MSMDINTLKNLRIFEKLSTSELESAITYLEMKTRKYRRNVIIRSYINIEHIIGIVLTGGVQEIFTDCWGNRTYLEITGAGDFFFQSSLTEHITTSPSNILYINMDKLFKCKTGNRHWINQLLANILHISLKNTEALKTKLLYQTPGTVQGKVLLFLSINSILTNSKQITLSCNREDLATQLGMDRTTLSKELRRLQKAGMIDVHGKIINICVDPPASDTSEASDKSEASDTLEAPPSVHAVPFLEDEPDF